jgi:hypothetical protein
MKMVKPTFLGSNEAADLYPLRCALSGGHIVV